MTSPIKPSFVETNLDLIDTFEGKIVCFMTQEGSLNRLSKRVNKLAKGVLTRFAESENFAEMPVGSVQTMDFPASIKAKSIIVIKLGKNTNASEARDAGAAAIRSAGKSDVMFLAGASRYTADVTQGMTLYAYDFNDHKSGNKIDQGSLTVLCNGATGMELDFVAKQAQSEGVFFTRDLVNEPANVLTTETFAERLIELEKLGIKVKVLEESDMRALGMDSLLSVGLGSPSPSKLVVMEWLHGGDEKPFAFVGKGVVFDTGGISLKPATGMEDMTMDMGGAGVVSGVMKTLAMRKAKANIVGLVGLVENMPDGKAQRPGDVRTSMKGETIEVINTDAEGRLVLADVLWYAQKTYDLQGIINLATLTGAIIIGLGHEKAGVFSNNDALSRAFLKAAEAEDEGAWRMPLSPAYHKLIKSRIADIKNTGGRAAGSITAAAFLEVFVKPDMPWIHLDIAGVASVKTSTALSPAGATGWGVRALDRLISDNYEWADD